MKIIKKGNLITEDAEALVSTVNCEGYMGKGVALQFKKAFPANYDAYHKACKHGHVSPGKMFVFQTGRMVNPKYIINFPTKRNWRQSSRLEDIKSGLDDLVKVIQDLRIHSIAIPPLGCGLGGLRWYEVRPLIESAIDNFPNLTAYIFEPSDPPTAEQMPVRTTRPMLTPSRALLIRLMHQYSQMEYRMTLLEIQKLAYFLQEAGEPLKLNYVAHIYGPYAHNLNKVLEILEGHFTRGYGDTQKPDVEIRLLPGAIEKAADFIAAEKIPFSRLERVAKLIEGFETPYGMELLSSAHWVAVHQIPNVDNSEEAISAIHKWNERKRKIFKAEHIKMAWARLSEQGWLLHSRP